MAEQLANALADLDEDYVLERVKELFEGGTPAIEILASLQEGMEIVGKRFEKKDYFLSELIMSGDIFKNAAGILGDAFSADTASSLGTFVMGTVKDDIHDIGKDIVVTILRCNGIKVVDLGVDVPKEKFVEAIIENKPQIVGMSCLLTSTFDNMKETIKAIEAAGLRDHVKVLIGGGPTDEKVRDYVTADVYCKNAQEAVDSCKKLLVN